MSIEPRSKGSKIRARHAKPVTLSLRGLQTHDDHVQPISNFKNCKGFQGVTLDGSLNNGPAPPRGFH
jgi:hypothetical protein